MNTNKLERARKLLMAGNGSKAMLLLKEVLVELNQLAGYRNELHEQAKKEPESKE